MDAFNIFVKQSFLTSGHFNLHFEDFATLSCVSHDLETLVNDVYGKDNTKLICNKLLSLGVSECNANMEHLINTAQFIKAIILIKRLVGNNEIKCKTKLVKFVNEFTKSYMQTIFTGYVEPCIKKQCATVRIMLDITEASRDVREVKYVTRYIIMYFITKIVKCNSIKFLCNEDVCMMGYKKFRRVVCSKATEMSEQIKNDICLLPNGFINRVVRMLHDTRRIVEKLR